MMKNYISPEMKVSLFSVERIATDDPAVTIAPESPAQLAPDIVGLGKNAVLKSYNIKNAIELK